MTGMMYLCAVFMGVWIFARDGQEGALGVIIGDIKKRKIRIK
jgi:hypothetical protein